MRARIAAARVAFAAAIAGAVATGLVQAQGRGGVEWTTSGFDAQRAGWIRNDPRISVETLQRPGAFGPFKFLWKLKLEHDPHAPAALTEPVLLDRLIGFRGFKSIAFVATASETVHAIDIDVGTPLWKYHINYSASPPPVRDGSPDCPGGLTAALSRPTSVAPSTVGAGGVGGGRGGRSGGGVGEPGRGAITLATAGRGRAAAAPAAAPGGAPPAARAGGPGGGGGFGGPFVPGADAAYVVGSDGYLHALNVSNGWDSMTPALFLPANTHARGLLIATAADGAATAYVATTNGCGSQPDAVWAMDLGSAQKTVTAFRVKGGTIGGAAGPALSRDGTVYIATTEGSAPMSNALIALAPTTLELRASSVVPKADFTTSPLVFTAKDKEVVAVGGSGKLFLFDSKTLAPGPIAVSAAYGAPAPLGGALATWQDAQGTRWIAAPSSRGIVAFKVVETDSTLTLQPAWTSREIASPLAPLAVNGVVFAASSGTRALPSVLYAIDAATGKDLWNSGKSITTMARGGLSAGQGNVYVPGADGTLYAFGFAIEK